MSKSVGIRRNSQKIRIYCSCFNIGIYEAVYISMKRNICIICILMVVVIICSVLALIIDFFNLPSNLLGIQIANFNDTVVLSIITILGSFIAGILTLLGVIITIEENNKDKTVETKRLIKPLLKISSAEYDYKWKYIQFDFNLTDESKKRERKDISNTARVTLNFENIGQRELCEFYLCEFKSTFFYEGGHAYKLHPIIYSGDSVNINFFVYEKGSYDTDDFDEVFHTLASPISFSCLFDDCLGNHYKQEFEITLFHQVSPNIPLEESALSLSIDRINICSAPKELTDSDYKQLIENAWICEGQ